MTTKQGRLDGMTPPHIAELEDLADELKECETTRLEAQKEETQRREKLTAMMKEHKLTRYQLGEDREIVIEATEEKAFVRKIKRAGPGRPPKKKQTADAE